MTNKGVKISTALQYLGNDVYVLDLHCYQQASDGAEARVGIYLKRAMDVYVRYKPQHIVQAAGLPGSYRHPIFLRSVTDTDTMDRMASDDMSRGIRIEFPESTSQYRVDDISAVPEAYWHNEERCFSFYNLRLSDASCVSV